MHLVRSVFGTIFIDEQELVRIIVSRHTINVLIDSF
jgi:hypothetical protein